MILVDTSIWIEFFKGTSNELAHSLSINIENNQVVALSVVFGELLHGVRDQREEKVILEFWKNLPKINETDLFIEGGKLSFRYKLFLMGVGLVDCYILAASKLYGLDVLSLDKKLIHAYNLIKD